MARIRSVHPALFTDEAWVSCSPTARILFIGLWTDADDGGVFEWKTLQLKMRLLPADAVDVQEILAELEGAGLVRGFTEGGKSFGAIKDFRKYQRPQKPRPVYPLPEELIGFVTGKEGPQPDLFPDQSRSGTVNSNPMERRGEEDGIGGEGTGARRKSKISIPEGFPDDEAIVAAQEMISEARVILDPGRQATRFRSHAETNDRRCIDWRAAWRNWVDKGIETAPVLVHSTASEPTLTTAERVEIAFKRWLFCMDDWKKNRPWDRSIRGPRPDEIGCTIPDTIMAEFGHTPVRRAEG